MERLTLWITLTLSIAAIALLVAYKIESSIGPLCLLVPISLAHVLYVRSQAKRFSKIALDKGTTSISIAFSSAHDKIKNQQLALTNVIQAIGKIGDTDQTIDETKIEGEAGLAISNLKNKLHAIKEDEEQRVWIAQGIAQISEIRKDNSSLSDYAYQIISYLVKFLEANQGVVYVKNDDDNSDCLELLATYAYGRRKYNHERIILELGTGLIGQCALEGGMVILTDVPKDYVKITSGLGEALPRCITLTPLSFRGEVLGVIEIASFQKFSSHKIEFLKKACETIGLELSNVRSQERTRKLLEQSREEELRQNLEEMKTTQREMLLKEDQLNKQLINTQRAMAMADAERKKNEAILEGCMDAVISFKQNGTIEFFNQAAEEVFGVSRKDVLHQDIGELLNIHLVEGQDGTPRIMSITGNEVSLRTEISAVDSKGEETSLLLTATKVKIDNQYLFTLFAQKVSVELF
jgi:PAS domain S-box-containing protein